MKSTKAAMQYSSPASRFLTKKVTASAKGKTLARPSPFSAQKSATRSFDRSVLPTESEYQRDECGQIANEMILLVYEKTEKIKLQIKVRTEAKRKLEAERLLRQSELKDVKETIKRLERDKDRLGYEYEQIETDVARLTKAVDDVTQTIQTTGTEQAAAAQDLAAQIQIAKETVEKQKAELLELRDNEIPAETALVQDKETLEARIHAEEQLTEDLRKEVRLARAKEDVRVKKFKSNSKTLDVTVKRPPGKPQATQSLLA